MSVTAKQVQELMEDHSSQYPSPTDPYVWITEYDYQAIADELNAAMVGRGTCRKVYLVETSDELIESWYPIGVYLHREAAEDCAEAFRKKEYGVRQFARVSELKVVDE